MNDKDSEHEACRSREYIMIVEDDAAIRDALMAVLEDEGYQVRGAANGREALRLLRADGQRPRLILLDLMMPVMNGWDFRAEQQLDPDLAAIPVVVLSADRNASASAAAVQANGYLPKPVEFSALLDTVKSFLNPQ